MTFKEYWETTAEYLANRGHAGSVPYLRAEQAARRAWVASAKATRDAFYTSCEFPVLLDVIEDLRNQLKEAHFCPAEAARGRQEAVRKLVAATLVKPAEPQVDTVKLQSGESMNAYRNWRHGPNSHTERDVVEEAWRVAWNTAQDVMRGPGTLSSCAICSRVNAQAAQIAKLREQLRKTQGGMDVLQSHADMLETNIKERSRTISLLQKHVDDLKQDNYKDTTNLHKQLAAERKATSEAIEIGRERNETIRELQNKVEELKANLHDLEANGDAGETVQRNAALEENRRAMEAKIARLQAQLPEGMEHCTIQFIKCEKGHGRLTAANWTEHGCPHCEIERLQAELADAKADRMRGNCRMLSDSDACECGLCKREREIARLRDIVAKLLEATSHAHSILSGVDWDSLRWMSGDVPIKPRFQEVFTMLAKAREAAEG